MPLNRITVSSNVVASAARPSCRVIATPCAAEPSERADGGERLTSCSMISRQRERGKPAATYRGSATVASRNVYWAEWASGSGLM